MPRYWNEPDNDNNDIDLNYAGEGFTRYTDATSQLSDNNSFYAQINADTHRCGDMDRIASWPSAQIRIAKPGALTLCQYEMSSDGGKTYPFVVKLDNEITYFEFPLVGQLGRLRFTTASTWPSGGLLQIVVVYRKYPAALGGGSVTTTGSLLGTGTQALNVRVVNDWMDDYFLGKIQGRTTGFCAGYCDNIDSDFQSVHPITSGFVRLPPPAGVTNVLMASSSAADTQLGTGIFGYLLIYMKTDFSTDVAFVFMQGTTPASVNVTVPIYRFIIAFAFGAGAAYNSTFSAGPLSNVGINYIGTGAFNPASGFATTYLRNRIGDGQLASPTYTCPKGKKAMLWELKYAAEAAKPVIMRTFQRGNATNPWVLQIEDVAQNTIQPRRSLIGGWNDPGSEFTVVGKKTGGTGVLANFIMTVIEVDLALFASYIP
jgi:hypothetical protein